MLRGIIVCILFCLSSVVIVSAATFYVPDDYPTIQGAIDASQHGDVIIVRAGTYFENIDFTGKNITVESESGPDSTVIDGNQSGAVVMLHNYESSSTVLEGFTLTNGTGEFYNSYSWGGAIFCWSSSPVIRNNVITGNWAELGGAICCDQGASPAITGNIIKTNIAEDRGGAIYCDNDSNPAIVKNLIFQNEVTLSSGGAIYSKYSSPTISGNTILDNFAHTHGAGIYLTYGSPVIENNTILLNYSDSGGDCGGGVHSRGGSPVLTGNVIGNNAGGNGGGLSFSTNCEPTVVNNMIYGNTALDDGGGICCDESDMSFACNTMFGNTAAGKGGGILFRAGSTATMINSILWDNDAPEGPEMRIGGASLPSTITISHSDVDGGQASVYMVSGCTLNWGAGMIDADPLVVESGNGDLHLTIDSPCRDTGNSAAVTEQLDFEGDPRIAGSEVDMGADEFHEHLYHLGDATPGGKISIRIIGTPTAPVTLALGSGIQEPPMNTPYGDLYLAFPLVRFSLGPIPSNGALLFPATVPASWQAGEGKPLQALIGPFGNPASVLSNLLVLQVE
jgi:hypothetical protein